MSLDNKNNKLACAYIVVSAFLIFPLFPLKVDAWDFTPDSTRYLSDPAYLPLKGQVTGDTDFSFSDVKGNTTSASGTSLNSFASDDRMVAQTVGYGITDDISVHVLETLGWARNKYYSVAGGAQSRSDTGSSDPTFGATWRALDQKDFPVSWDISMDYMPNLFKASNGDFSPVGPMARGGQELGMSAALSYETRDFTVYAGFEAFYLGSCTIHDVANDSDSNYDSSWEYVLNLQTQTRFNELMALNLGAQEQFYQGYNAVTSTAEPYEADANNITALNAALNFQLIPNRLVAGITYQFDIYGNTSYKFAAPNTTNGTNINSEYNNIVGINLSYVLF